MRTLGSYTLIVMFFFFIGQLGAQSASSAGIATLDETTVLTDLNYLPSFPANATSSSTNKPLFRALPIIADGQKAISTFLRDITSYPEIAVENSVEGTLVLALEVDANGNIANAEIVEPLFGPIDQLVLDNTQQLPQLLPAVFNGTAINKELIIPIQFRLQ